MSLKQMESAVRQAKLPEGQMTWWPRWLEKYARWTRQIDANRIEIREQSLIELLRSLRDSGKNAYTRLQLVRAVQFYQQQVLVADSPDSWSMGPSIVDKHFRGNLGTQQLRLGSNLGVQNVGDA
jgi:hypothetical protein